MRIINRGVYCVTTDSGYWASGNGGCRRRAWHYAANREQVPASFQYRQYSELTTMASRSEVDLPDLGIWMTATVPCRHGNISITPYWTPQVQAAEGGSSLLFPENLGLV